MAETLSVTDMLPNKFEPKRNYRWVLAIEGIDSFLAKTTKRPDFTLTDKKIDFINSYRKVSGKLDMGDISVQLHDPIAPSGAQQVMEWIRTHYESVSGRAGYADFYKRDIQLKLLDPIGTVVESYSSRDAIRHLSQGEVCVFVAGTGNPFFTTDTAACLRGIEIEANLILKATKVDGVYNKDPSKYDDAVKYDNLTFDQVLDEKLGVMDLTAICLCRDHNVPLQVFDMNKSGALLSVVMGEKEGTHVTN